MLMCFLAGCQGDQTTSPKADTDTPSGAAEVMDYLQKQNLPAVDSVEKWAGDYGEGLVITTDHYRIYTTLMSPLMLYQMPGFMESAYMGYQNQLPSPIETDNKFTIYLFADRRQWDDFTKKFAGHQADIYLKIIKGAYYLNGSCVAYNIGKDRTFSVLGHEGWHQFNSRHFKYRLPSWLDEGIAMLFETSRYEDGWFYFEPGRNLGRLGGLKKALLENRMIPLEELITLNPGEVMADQDTGAVTAFYSQAYAMVRFLREEDYGRRLRNFQQMLLGGLNGTWPLEGPAGQIAADRNIPLTVPWNRHVAPLLFKTYITGDISSLEQEYTNFCRKIVYKVHFIK